MEPNLNEENTGRLPWFDRIWYATWPVGLQLPSFILLAWLNFFYLDRKTTFGEPIVLANALTFGILFFIFKDIGRLFAPLLGHWSDVTTHRLGRRRLWILVGGIIAPAAYLLLWYPPEKAGITACTVWLVFFLGALSLSRVAGSISFGALLPQLTTSNRERLNLSLLVELVPIIPTGLIPPLLSILIDQVEHDPNIWPIPDAAPYRFPAIVLCIAAVVFIFFYTAYLKERRAEQVVRPTGGIIASIKHCSKNPAFFPLLAAEITSSVALGIIMASVPFLGTRIAGASDFAASTVMAVLIFPSFVLVFWIRSLALKHGKRKILSLSLLIIAVAGPLMATILYSPFFGSVANAVFGGTWSIATVRLIQLAVILAVLTIPFTATSLVVRVAVADVTDLDKKRTGENREGLYYGIFRAATYIGGLGGIAGVPGFIARYGDTIDRPWGILALGPISGLLALAGWYIFRRYPIEK
jgi:glycoside/pentoside/hexuronide:cation symporter, GPH family